MFPDEHPEGFCELYDLSKDPWEMENLALQEQYAEVVRDMKESLLNWLITTTRPTTVHPLPATETPQRIARYHHTVNADNRVNPRRVADLPYKNYL
jgi:hypothetical protein